MESLRAELTLEDGARALVAAAGAARGRGAGRRARDPRHVVLLGFVCGLLASPLDPLAPLPIALAVTALAGRATTAVLAALAVLAGAALADARTAALGPGPLATEIGRPIEARAIVLEPLRRRADGSASARVRLIARSRLASRGRRLAARGRHATGSFTRALLEAEDEPGEIACSTSRTFAQRPVRRRSALFDDLVARSRWRRGRGPRDRGARGDPRAPTVPDVAAEEGVDVDREASSGARLLLLARADAPDRWSPIAVLAFADLLRPGVESALRMATGAGIQTMVVTGDHPATATSIARGAGIDAGRVVTGADLATWDDDQLRHELGGLAVVARAAPEDKLRLVDAARVWAGPSR